VSVGKMIGVVFLREYRSRLKYCFRVEVSVGVDAKPDTAY